MLIVEKSAMLVDAHVHCFRDEVLPEGNRRTFATMAAWKRTFEWTGPRRRRLPPADQRGPWGDSEEILHRAGASAWDPDGTALIGYMDEAGVSKAVQMTLDWGIAWGEEPAWDIRQVNRFALEMSEKHPGRLYAACGVDPRRRDAAAIAEEMITAGAVAIKLMPAAGFTPDDPICYPIYEVARDTQTPIVIHTGTGDIAANVSAVHPYHIEQPAKLFPRVQFVLAHAGGDMDGLWREVIMLANFIPNIAVDLAEWQYVIQPTELDTGREEEFLWTLNTLRRNIGPHNIMWATDFIKGHRPDNDLFWAQLFLELPERAKRVGVFISEEEAEAMRATNAIRIFGLHSR